MKIKRTIAAVMALVLVGGAYPSNAVNTRNIGKVYAAETAAEEKEPKFFVEKESSKRLEPYSIAIKNVDPATVTFTLDNADEVSRTSDEDGKAVFTFRSRKSGEAHVAVSYEFDGEIRQNQFTFNILEETYEDENSPKFFVEKESSKRLEPYSIAIKNVDPATVTFTLDNADEVSRTSDEDGKAVFTFRSRKSGEAHVAVSYEFDGEIRQNQFTFNILEETYEDENSPKFFVEKESSKRLEPYSIAIKNVDPATVTFTLDNADEVSRTSDEDGKAVFTFRSRKSGEAHVAVSYEFDGEIRQNQFTFNILEETYEDENSPKFFVEKESSKRLEPYSIAIKNVDPATVTFTLDNADEVSRTSDEDGKAVFTFRSRKSGEAHVAVSYEFDGEIRQNQFTFNILEETYEDENSPKFFVEQESSKRLEPYSIAIKNVDPATVTFTLDNADEVSRTSDEDGKAVFTFRSRKSGEAHVAVSYEFDGEIRQNQFTFNILEETYEDENSPKFFVEKESSKRLEPYSIAIKNVDPATVTFTLDNADEVSRTSDEDGKAVFTFRSRKSGEAHVAVSYEFDGEIRQNQFTFNILDEEYEEETAQNTNVKGDANCDGIVDMSDVVLIMQALANPNKYGVNGTNELHITQQGVDNGDVDSAIKGLTVSDALKIQRYLLGGIKTL